MPLVIVFSGIVLLFLLITLFKFNGFISFILVAIGIGIAQGMQLNDIVDSIENGIGIYKVFGKMLNLCCRNY